MRKMFFLLVLLVLVLAGANFAFCQTKLSSEQKKNNEHEMLMRMIRNKDRDRSLEIEYISLEGDSISKFKRQIYRGYSSLKKTKSSLTDDKFDTIGPMDESLDLTTEELRNKQIRDSLSKIYFSQPLPWDKFSDSVMSEKKDLQFANKQDVNQMPAEENNYYLAKAFFLSLIVAALCLAINQWTYRFDEKTLTKKLP